jgi:hypothetical protein
VLFIILAKHNDRTWNIKNRRLDFIFMNEVWVILEI